MNMCMQFFITKENVCASAAICVQRCNDDHDRHGTFHLGVICRREEGFDGQRALGKRVPALGERRTGRSERDG